MTEPKILTREEVEELRKHWTGMYEKGAPVFSALATIEHVYAQRDALLRVKEAADQWRKEFENPVPDVVMRRATRGKLSLELAAYAEAEKSGFRKDSPNA